MAAEQSWTQNPSELFRIDRLTYLFPNRNSSAIESFNSLSRAVVFAGAISYYISRSTKDLIYSGLALFALNFFMGKSESLDGDAAPVAAPVATTLPVTRKAALAAIESTDVAVDTPPARSEIVNPRPNQTISTPQGTVKIQRGQNIVSAASGIASTPARMSYLSMKPGESFPGQNVAIERLGTRGEVRHRTQFIPSDAEIHAAYRPVPAVWKSRAEDDYMNGFVGPYKRIANLV